MRITLRGYVVIGIVFFAVGALAPWDLLPWAVSP
jgi:hypothetical protein